MTDPDPAGLLDTNVVIDLGQCDPADLPAEPLISSVTLAELSAGPVVAATHDEQIQRQHVLQLTESTFDPVAFDGSCARHFATVAASMRTNGRKAKARAFDALIAATALTHELPLYTKNPRDFSGIPGLVVREVTTDG